MSEVKNLYLKYDNFTISIPKLELLDQGVTALCGPNGSGKTTVVRALLGLEKATGMEWVFKGEDLARLKPADRKIGVVFQGLELFPHMSARQNVMFAASARNISKTEAEGKLKELSNLLNVDHFLDQSVSVLSGGEKQRTALMRALIGSPRMLFLDEPFSALDKHLRTEARKLIKSIVAKHNIPALLVTHDDDDLKELASKVIYLDNGRVQTT